MAPLSSTVRKRRTTYVNPQGKVVKIDPERSRLMQQVMRHRKGKPLPQTTKNKISKAVKKAYQSGRNKYGKPIRKRKPAPIF
jgi:hypothetical protein